MKKQSLGGQLDWLYHKPINTPSLSVPLRKLFNLQPIMEMLLCFSPLSSFLFHLLGKPTAPFYHLYFTFTQSKKEENIEKKKK